MKQNAFMKKEATEKMQRKRWIKKLDNLLFLFSAVNLQKLLHESYFSF